MSKPIQKLETRCFPQRSDNAFDFNLALDKWMSEIASMNWSVKQVSTTSFVWKSELYIAYTVLIEK